MTPQDTQALEVFLTQLTQARAGAKDPQAEALIAQAGAIQPDVAYLLVQRAMLLDHALSTAKAQIAALQGQLQAAQASGSRSFIDQQNAWGASANPAAATPVPAPAQAVSPALQTPPAQSPRPGFLSGGFGSTLGSIATTAAGVAGGAFLFQGIENLFGHSSKNAILEQSGMNTPGTETNVVNNYYGNDDQASVAASYWGSDSGNLDAGLSDDGFLDDDSTVI